MIMFVHVVPVYGWCPWGGGHWALDMNGDMHTRLWTRGAGAKSLYQLHSVSLAGLCLHCSGRGRDWALVSTRVSGCLSAGRSLTPGSLAEPATATTCPSVQTRAAQYQHHPSSTPSVFCQRVVTILVQFGCLSGHEDENICRPKTQVSYSEFMNIFSIIEGRQKTNYPCFRSRKISFLGYFTSLQDLGINENILVSLVFLSFLPRWFT